MPRSKARMRENKVPTRIQASVADYETPTSVAFLFWGDILTLIHRNNHTAKNKEANMAKWTIDPDHSVAGFSVRHMMVTDVRGTVTGITGTILFDPAALEQSSVEASITLSGLTTGVKKRDEHLFSADFFDTGKYPLMTFRSAKVEKTGSNRGKIIGDLTVHGVTRTVVMDAEYFGPVKSPADLGGETTIGFSATLKINREDFGITWNVPLGDSNLMVGREVLITVDIEADLSE